MRFPLVSIGLFALVGCDVPVGIGIQIEADYEHLLVEYDGPELTGEYGVVTEWRMDEVFPFEWETASVFGEYQHHDWVEQEIGVDLLDSAQIGDVEALLVFCADGEVVKLVDYPYESFTGGDGRTTFSRDAVYSEGHLHEPDSRTTSAQCA